MKFFGNAAAMSTQTNVGYIRACQDDPDAYEEVPSGRA